MCPHHKEEEEDPCGAPDCFNCPSWMAPCKQLFKCKDGSWKQLDDCPFYNAFPVNRYDQIEHAPEEWAHSHDLPENKTDTHAPGFDEQPDDLTKYSDLIRKMGEGVIFTETDFADLERSDFLDVVPREVIEVCDIPRCLPCDEPCVRQPSAWCGDWEVPVRICLDMDK